MQNDDVLLIGGADKKPRELDKNGLTPVCNLRTIQQFHGKPGESAKNPEVLARVAGSRIKD
jgi:hypothetical protein